MSRRPPTAADASERNRLALKSLVKLESNKSCADCKRNKHPRWASWNLGVFVCIRCSGIHRSLGVHISRVKSVDLDSWTDEQLGSMVKWGNRRANKYWENKLAEGHVPNEAKIENFIRTKYDSRRWVMDGPMPDPSTLDDAGDDDDVPLKVVQERARAASGTARNGPAVSGSLPQAPRARPQEVDLFGDNIDAAPARPSTTGPALSRPGPPKATAAPPKQTRPGESLLGLDFFGGSQSAAPARPASTGPATPGVPGRTDLKQSILSLYASKPAAPPQPTSNANAFGGMQSPPLASPTQSSSSAQFGGLGDAFSSLSFGSTTQAPAKASSFSGLSPPSTQARQAPASKPSALSGGGFFDAKPPPPPKPTTQSPPAPTSFSSARKASFGNDFGDFSTAASQPPAPSNASNMGDLFSLASPAMTSPTLPTKLSTAPLPTQVSSPPPISAANYMNSSAFNLSQTAAPKPTAAPAPAQTSSMNNFSSMSNADAWGSNDAWATPDPEPVAKPAAPTSAPAPVQTNASAFRPAPAPAAQTPFDSGWGDPEPAPAKPAAPANTSAFSSSGGFNVQQDEEFGGWSHASPVATTSGPKQGGVGGNQDDLFGNVWE